MLSIFAKEPAMIIGLIAAVLTAAFTLQTAVPLTPEIKALIDAAAVVVASFIIRSRVSPVAPAPAPPKVAPPAA